jgi:AraC family transcriptional regulator
MLRGMDDADAPSRPLAHIADPLARAAAYVEASAFEPLTLADLAAVAGLSPYHFARQFTARFGLAPMAFVRARRLGLAAMALASPEPPALVDLAFDSGFESQEGFTRAFKRAFGVSPGHFRRHRAAPVPMEILAMPDLNEALKLTQEAAPAKKPGFRLAGISAIFDETNKAGIPALWGQLEPRLPLAGQLGYGTYGVGCPTDDAPEGSFRYAAAVEVAAGAPAPEGCEAWDIPEQTYLIFHLQTDGTDLHTQMQAAVQEIWGKRVPNSGHKLANAPDLEVYPDDFAPDRPSRVAWWIPVEA